MCVMAGLGLDDGRAGRALASVADRLATPHGIALLQPAYTRYHLELGEISSYPPGYKENAGVFCHTNPWVMIAEAMAGNGERAFDYYLRINPSAREAIGDVHRCEPYVYAQMIAGPDAPTFGEAKNSWLTGSAAWNFVAITQWILGSGPSIAACASIPCLPASWDGFEAVRRFRGATYEISVAKPAGTAGRVDGLLVDGHPVGERWWPRRRRGRRSWWRPGSGLNADGAEANHLRREPGGSSRGMDPGIHLPAASVREPAPRGTRSLDRSERRAGRASPPDARARSIRKGGSNDEPARRGRRPAAAPEVDR